MFRILTEVSEECYEMLNSRQHVGGLSELIVRARDLFPAQA